MQRSQYETMKYKTKCIHRFDFINAITLLHLRCIAFYLSLGNNCICIAYWYLLAFLPNGQMILKLNFESVHFVSTHAIRFYSVCMAGCVCVCVLGHFVVLCVRFVIFAIFIYLILITSNRRVSSIVLAKGWIY